MKRFATLSTLLLLITGITQAQTTNDPYASKRIDSVEFGNDLQHKKDEHSLAVNSVTPELIKATQNTLPKVQAINPDSSTQKYAASLMDSKEFGQEVVRVQNQNRLVSKSVTQEVVDNTRKMLPKFNDVGSELKFGAHNTVSKDGEKVIIIIRNLTSGSEADRQANLKKLTELSSEGVPEAMNFIGFAEEYGLFGAHVNVPKAIQFYKAAAAANYQPAIYNLALASAYGKDARADMRAATMYIQKAAMISPDSSFRVCGFGSFLNYRQGNQSVALRFASGCPSPLAGLPQALSTNTGTFEQRIEALRKSIATGVDDGLPLLAKLAEQQKKNDGQYIYCKYSLVQKYWYRNNTEHLKTDALECFNKNTLPTDNKNSDIARRDQAIPGIVAFVPTEISALQSLRKSNHFHFSWSVPYLPFPQSEVDLFEPLIQVKM